MRRAIIRLSLVGAGALGVLIGGSLMFFPKAFLAMSDVFIDHDPGLLSELTAPSGILILGGTLMILAATRLRFAPLALFFGAAVYGSYGVARLVGMALHGIPSDTLISATIIEVTVATLLTALGIMSRSDQSAADMSVHAHQLSA
ncbi:MAG: DUF4345 domain-containing protein [Pseudomonadota bacterium]